MTAKATTNHLSETAMLVDLTIRQWSGSRSDQRATKAVSEAFGVVEGMGTYRKSLIAREALEDVRRAAHDANRKHRELTLPWLNDGTRILSAKGYLQYLEDMRSIEQRFTPAVKLFVKMYPGLQDEARGKLGTLYTMEEYPTPKEIATKFGFEYRFYPMPDADDFRVNIGNEEASRVKAQIEDSINQAIKIAMRDAYSRVAEVVGHMVERLKAYTVTVDGVKGKFHDSLVENVRDLIGAMPMLNVTNDPALTALTRQMEQSLLAHSAQELRDSKKARTETATAAKAILVQMKEFMA